VADPDVQRALDRALRDPAAWLEQADQLKRAADVLLVGFQSAVGGWMKITSTEWNAGFEVASTDARGELAPFARLGDRAENYIAGGDAEEAVGAQLRPLRDEGWVVVDNVVRDDGGGNVDHFASAPGGRTAYAIETKSGKTRAADRGQAISNAIWAKNKFGARYVTAVLCVGKDAPEEPTQVPHGRSTVWLIGRADLARWLRTLPR